MGYKKKKKNIYTSSQRGSADVGHAPLCRWLFVILVNIVFAKVLLLNKYVKYLAFLQLLLNICKQNS